jgi:hypothetical protein
VPFLTDELIRALPKPEGKSHPIVWDEDADSAPGSSVTQFGLKRTPGGSRSFVLSYRNADGVQRQIVVGHFPTTRTEAARAKARKLAEAIDLSYGVFTVTGDHYAANWPVEQFGKYGISYAASEKSKSDLYADLLPQLNSGRIELPDHPRLISQLTALERRSTRGTGRDAIDHPAGNFHDDVANAVAGIASPAIGTGASLDYSGWNDGTEADADPGIERARRAQRLFQEHLDRISQPPQPPWDLLNLIERSKRRGDDHASTTD